LRKSPKSEKKDSFVQESVALTILRTGRNTRVVCSQGIRLVAKSLWATAVALTVLDGGCRSPGNPQPSFVFAVLDTTRADAVSAYGKVRASTPHVDDLARQGLLYEHAYANANWTLPSHASIFTGLLPSQNGLRGQTDTLGAVPTFVDELRAAGYETVGVSENPWLRPDSELAQRFEHYFAAGVNMKQVVRSWVEQRDGDRPFFLFLNIMDSHTPYRVRAKNPFLPPGWTAEEARAVSQSPEHYQCQATQQSEELRVLHGLYLGNVRAADAKLRTVLNELEPLRARHPTVVIVTSDHGESFGEHGLVDHDVGVGNALLHVPLVVHGLPDVAPARIESPVQLIDLAPSILRWAGVRALPHLPGVALPKSNDEQRQAPLIIAEYYDYNYGPRAPEEQRRLVSAKWKHCGPQDRYLGDMRAMMDFPYKLIWYEKYSPQLFDLRSDPAEKRDLAPTMPDRVEALGARLRHVLASLGTPPPAPTRHLDPAQVERLRALGYLGGPAETPHP
jgi:arylsulfatase A-like enzyme